jgi:hypothetical protein
MFGGYAHLKGFFFNVIRFVCVNRDACIHNMIAHDNLEIG